MFFLHMRTKNKHLVNPEILKVQKPLSIMDLKKIWVCSEFYQAYPWVTKFEIIAQGSPMCGMLSILLTLCELSWQSSTNQINMVDYNIIATSIVNCSIGGDMD